MDRFVGGKVVVLVEGVMDGESRGVPSVLFGGLLLEVLFRGAALSHDVDCR